MIPHSFIWCLSWAIGLVWVTRLLDRFSIKRNAWIRMLADTISIALLFAFARWG